LRFVSLDVSEKVPARVQILFNLTHPLALGIGGGTLSFLPEELVLLMYQLAYPLSRIWSAVSDA